jgi:hypothetical protein
LFSALAEMSESRADNLYTERLVANMAFKNVVMTNEEIDWRLSLGIKNQMFEYRYNLRSIPNGSYMTVDRERELYLFGLMADNGREPPTEDTLYYFYFMWQSGHLYFSSHKEFDEEYLDDNEIEVVKWHIHQIDLFENNTRLSKGQILAYLAEALGEYGKNGVGWDGEPLVPNLPGRAFFDKALFSGDWIE